MRYRLERKDSEKVLGIEGDPWISFGEGVYSRLGDGKGMGGGRVQELWSHPQKANLEKKKKEKNYED